MSALFCLGNRFLKLDITTMKQFFIAMLCASFSLAQESELPEATKNQTIVRKKLLTEIFSQLDTPAFKQAIEKSRQAGIPEQILLEARFLHLIDQDDHNALVKLAPELEAYRDKFDLALSEIFGVQEDWLSVIHYTQALVALDKKDEQEFKKHITEAFWLNPRHAQIYAPHIERLRLNNAMANITISSDLKLQPQSGGVPTDLKALSKGKKAFVLHFWSPISQEVADNMEDFTLTSHECSTHEIAVISILIGSSPETIQEAELIRKQHQDKAQCTWVVDSSKSTLTKILRITDIPTMVILSTDGKVLFNGHPSETKFWNTIKSIAPNFKRPNNNIHNHTNE